jgi:hypothetical protein
LLHRCDEDTWTIGRVVMAFLAAERAALPVKEHALADMGLHVAFSRLRKFAGAIAKWTIRIGDFYGAFARTDWALLNVGLSHLP